uniref:Uncharacterized protein n=1 Tax=Timema shepardi TaxID=629360 RepID=A0A7R9AX02_TIMSH|nr:unnamed protein product [Timema shepardi]
MHLVTTGTVRAVLPYPSKKRKRAKFVPDVNAHMLHDLDPTSRAAKHLTTIIIIIMAGSVWNIPSSTVSQSPPLSIFPMSLLRLLPLTLAALSTFSFLSIATQCSLLVYRSVCPQARTILLSAGCQSAERWLSVGRALAVGRPSAGCRSAERWLSVGRVLAILPDSNFKNWRVLKLINPKTQYTHQRQMYGGMLATTPSPNPSPSPQSHGRTPSSMDYTPAPAHAFYHPTSGMVMYRHTDFMGMGEVFQSPQVPVEGMVGAVNGKFLPTNPLVMFNPQRVLNPARRMPQTDMDMSGQGSTWGPVAPSSSPAISGFLEHSSMNIPPPAVSSVAGSVNPGEGSILDLDSHQYSLGQLDSAELANLSLFDGNLSENLSANLTSENPPPELKQEQTTQQQQQQQNDVQQENMTDSFTRLTTTTLEDIYNIGTQSPTSRSRQHRDTISHLSWQTTSEHNLPPLTVADNIGTQSPTSHIADNIGTQSPTSRSSRQRQTDGETITGPGHGKATDFIVRVTCRNVHLK